MTRDIVVIAIKAVAGGSLVVVLSLLGEVLRPKWFAGLFSAAPSVAIASLTVTLVDKGAGVASQAALGMVCGAVGFVVFAACARPLLDRFHAALASAMACLGWGVAATVAYLVVIR